MPSTFKSNSNSLNNSYKRVFFLFFYPGPLNELKWGNLWTRQCLLFVSIGTVPLIEIFKKYTFFWVSAHCARGPSIWPSSSNRIDALKNHDVYKISLAISIIKVKFLFLRWFAVKSAMNFKEIVQFGGYFWDPCEVKKKIVKKITNYILAQYLLQYFFLI